MKKIMKNIISMFVSMVLIIAGTNVSAYSDTKATWAESQIGYISSYGIMQGYEDGNFYPDNAITRAEMVSVALRMIKMDVNLKTENYEGSFSDVAKEHWAFDTIENAVALGLVNGYPDGTFRPDGFVTYQEAIKIIVALLGYDGLAQKQGGWFTGYMNVAITKKLFNISNVDMTTPASRAAVAVMAYNALQTPIFDETFYSNGDIRYTLGERTLLDIYFNAQINTGLVTATSVEGLYGEEAPYGKIKIDDVLYNCKFDATEFLGNKVKFSYEEVSGEKTVLYMETDYTKQKKVTVTSEQAQVLSGVYTSDGSLIYRKDKASRIQELKLSTSLSLIYNNQYIPYNELGSVELNISEGSYELIDYDWDNVFDCLKIKSYKDYYVNNISENSENKYITDGTGSSVIYSSDTEDTYESIKKDGEKISFNDIKPGNIVSVATAPNGQAVEIMVEEKEITGTVDVIWTEDGRDYLEIGGVKYPLSLTISRSNLDYDTNTTGTFKFNCFGEIARIAGEGDNGELYGYLSAMYKEDGIRADVQMRILTQENKFVDVSLADKVKLNDQGVERTLTPEQVYNHFEHVPVFYDQRTVITQVIKYKLNSDGKLSIIRTAKAVTPDNPYSDDFSYVLTSNSQPEGRRYYSNKLFDQQYQITEDTVAFKIPWTEEGEQLTRYTSGVASKMFSSGNYFQVQLFDIDEQNRVGAIMYTVYGQDRIIVYDIKNTSPLMIVDEVVTQKDENGEWYTTICGLVDGEYTSQKIDDEYKNEMNSAIKNFGSIVMYETNADTLQAAYYEDEEPGIVVASLQHNPGVSPKRIRWNSGNVEMASAALKTTYGTVKNINGFKVTIGDLTNVYADGQSITEADYFMSENTRVVIVNMSAKTMDIGNFYDIRPGDDIFIRQRNNTIRDVVIYR